jgi:hypothetical protein
LETLTEQDDIKENMASEAVYVFSTLSERSKYFRTRSWPRGQGTTPALKALKIVL